MTPTARSYRPAWWLRSPHLHSAWGILAWSRRRVPYRRNAIETPDGDELLVDHLDGTPGAPRLVVLHGIEASSLSPSVVGYAREARRRGWSVSALNYRSCARDLDDPRRVLMNRRPRMYHSGETEDLGHLLGRLPRGGPLVAVGTSIGANILLKWLAENPSQDIVEAAAAISCPFDLEDVERHLRSGAAGRLYARRFLRQLKPKIQRFALAFPGAPVDLAGALGARTLLEIDDAVTAPLHGFRSATEYYAVCSSLGMLHRVRTPALCVAAEDDPLLPCGVIERARALSAPALEWLVTPRGGHLGFIEGRTPFHARCWADRIVLDWLAAHVDHAGR